MGCTRAQVLMLLEKIREELRDERDKRLLDKYIEKIRGKAWHEIEMGIFYG